MTHLYLPLVGTVPGLCFLDFATEIHLNRSGSEALNRLISHKNLLESIGFDPKTHQVFQMTFPFKSRNQCFRMFQILKPIIYIR